LATGQIYNLSRKLNPLSFLGSVNSLGSGIMSAVVLNIGNVEQPGKRKGSVSILIRMEIEIPLRIQSGTHCRAGLNLNPGLFKSLFMRPF
jgi:hypothetical protein